MAENNTTTSGYAFRYSQLSWGDLIYATKAEMQSLGLAVGMAFPGEPGGPKRVLNVIDPRGFKTKIELAYNGLQYVASISFPGRESECLWRSEWRDFAPGVRVQSGTPGFDEYIGTPEALEAAGIVRADQLPGKPGMRKVKVTIFSDGTLADGAPTTNYTRKREPGTKLIERATKDTYRVCIVVTKEEAARRRNRAEQARAKYEAQMRVLPRPKRLSPCLERLLPRPALPVDFSTKVDWASCGWQPKK